MDRPYLSTIYPGTSGALAAEEVVRLYGKYIRCDTRLYSDVSVGGRLS